MALFLPFLASAASAYLGNQAEKKQNERDEARNLELRDKRRAEKEKRLKQVEGSFGLDKYTLDALEQARGRQGVKETQDESRLSAANQIELASRLGGRGGINASAIERQRQRELVDASQKQRQGEATALLNTAKAKQDLENKKRAFNEQEYGIAAADEAAAQENLFAAQDNEANRRTNFAQNLLSSAMPLFGAVGEGNFGQAMFGNMFGGAPVAKTGMKLPGEFSHKTNPIHFIKDGVKIGEGTGNEYVINSDQAKKIAKQSQYASMLFKKFDREA